MQEVDNAANSKPLCAQGPWRAIELCGCTMNSISLAEVFDAIDERIRHRSPGYIVTPNVDHICSLQEDRIFQEAYRNAFLALPDGTPVMWAARLLGKPLREKISGSDLIYWLSEYASRKGYSIFLLGAAEGVAAEAGRILQQQYPGLKVAGSYSPPMGFDESPAANAEVIRRLTEAQPDICFVALNTPKQDIWDYRNCEASGVPVLLGIGASLDFITGHQKRAPLWMQKSGLEWAYRLCSDPRRLWHRYLVRDSRFLVLLWREFRKKRG